MTQVSLTVLLCLIYASVQIQERVMVEARESHTVSSVRLAQLLLCRSHTGASRDPPGGQSKRSFNSAMLVSHRLAVSRTPRLLLG
jgi:hypothetical protein